VTDLNPKACDGCGDEDEQAKAMVTPALIAIEALIGIIN